MKPSIDSHYVIYNNCYLPHYYIIYQTNSPSFFTLSNSLFPVSVKSSELGLQFHPPPIPHSNSILSALTNSIDIDLSMGGGDTTTTTVKDEVAENNAGGGGETVTINVRCSNGSKFSVQVSLDSTVGSFKSVLSQPSDIPAEQQRLIYKGRILKDDQTLTSYGINYI